MQELNALETLAVHLHILLVTSVGRLKYHKVELSAMKR